MVYTNPNGTLCTQVLKLSDAAKSKLSEIPAPPADKLCPTLLNGPVNTCEPRAPPAAGRHISSRYGRARARWRRRTESASPWGALPVQATWAP